MEPQAGRHHAYSPVFPAPGRLRDGSPHPHRLLRPWGPGVSFNEVGHAFVLESFITAAGQSWTQCTSDLVPAFPLPLLFWRRPGASRSVRRALSGPLLCSLHGALSAIVDSITTASPSTPRFLFLSLLSPHPCTHPPLPPSHIYWLPGTVGALRIPQ